ncbi:MAG: CAP domain-containing protein [Planctomycetota bacterium]|jgi:hypothetical protein
MRRVLGVLLLLAAALPAEEGEKKTRLSGATFPKKLRWNHRLAGGREAAAEPVVRKGRVGKYHTYFVDLDGNGRFNDLGVDAWGLTALNYVLPLQPTAVIELTRLAWRVEEDGSFVHYRATPVPVDPRQAKVFRQFNYWRLINGLPPVDLDPEVSAACAAHCAWMERNGMKHVWQEGDSPMTPEGEQAGRRSCLSSEAPGMSVLMFYSTFYHRLPLFDPGTHAIGIGHSKRYTAIDGMTRREGRAWQYPIIVPAPGTALQPTHFPPESPRPYPPEITQPGFPITLTFDRGTVTEVRARMWMEKRKPQEIRLLVSSPEHPASQQRPDNRRSICLIPRRPLYGKGFFRVRVSYKLDGESREHEWVFTTGRPRPVFR